MFISKNNTAIHLGKATINLKELIERETAVQSAGFKTPVVQRTVRVFGGNSDIGVGMLRFKMRMRRPISEAMRFFREKNEIDNLRATSGM